MKSILRVSVLLLPLLAFGGAERLSAQVRPIVQSTARQDLMLYRAEMMEDYQRLMRAWSAALSRGDVRAASAFYAEDAVIVTATGEVMQGRPAIERMLRDQIAQWGGFQVGLLDFEASSSLLYGLGSYAHGSTGGQVTGNLVVLLQRSGRTLRIRSQTFHPNDG